MFSPLEILAAAGLIGTLTAILYILVAKPKAGNAALAATLCGAFLGFSLVTIWREGLLPVWTNHTANLWGIQVWWDLLLSVGLAFFLLTARARKVDMNIGLWALFVISTASIGLLAMAARLFWLERQS